MSLAAIDGRLFSFLYVSTGGGWSPLVWLLFSEKPGASTIVGGTVVFAAVAFHIELVVARCGCRGRVNQVAATSSPATPHSMQSAIALYTPSGKSGIAALAI